MRALLQRVRKASVSVDGRIVGQIEHGFVVLAGVGHGDGAEQVEKLAQKIVHLRVFNDDAGKFNRSLLDVGGHALVVSQFTLYADVRKGRRPSFTGAGDPAMARPLCDQLAQRLRELGVADVATGQFAAAMLVEIHNDGPVTIWIDTADLT